MIKPHIERMVESDIFMIIDLITRVFNQFEAPEYSEEGIQEFMEYLKENEFRKRLKKNHFILVARLNWIIIGVIEVRTYNHICLLFVDPKYHHQGVAKALFIQSRFICQENKFDFTEITVNSSPYAVKIYEKLGFQKISEEQVKNGLKFTPMVFSKEPLAGELRNR